MNKYSVPYITLVRSQGGAYPHIIGLYGTLAVRQAVLRLVWYIRPIQFEDSIRKKKSDGRFDSKKKRFMLHDLRRMRHCQRT